MQETRPRKGATRDARHSLPHFPLGTRRKRAPQRISRAAGLSKKGGDLLSRGLGSTIGASGLNFSVRNGKRWDTGAIAT